MRVSVVIPCHNSLRYLPETLDSVAAQEIDERFVSDLEVLLVDDGGSDDLAGWLGRSGHRTEGLGRVRVVRQDNAGVSAARNLGIRESTGDAVAFCDSDDLWTPTTVSELAAAIDRSPRIGLSYGGYDIVDGDGTPTGRRSICDWEGDVWDRLITGNTISASVVMVRREVFDDVGFFAENRERFPVDVEDWELWLRVALRWDVAAVPHVLMHVRRHESNSSLNVESIEAAYRNLLVVAFDAAGPAKDHLRPSATANIELRLASMWLNDRRDAVSALNHLRNARRQWAPVCRNTEYWSVWLTAVFLRLTGERGYTMLRGAVHSLRRVLGRIRPGVR